METSLDKGDGYMLLNSVRSDALDSVPKLTKSQEYGILLDEIKFNEFELDFDPELYLCPTEKNCESFSDSDGYPEDDVFSTGPVILESIREDEDDVDNTVIDNAELIAMADKESQSYGFCVFLHGHYQLDQPSKTEFGRSQRLSTQDSGVVEEAVSKDEAPHTEALPNVNELDSLPDDEDNAFFSRGSSCNSFHDELSVACQDFGNREISGRIGLLKIADERTETGERARDGVPVFDLDFDPDLYCISDPKVRLCNSIDMLDVNDGGTVSKLADSESVIAYDAEANVSCNDLSKNSLHCSPDGGNECFENPSANDSIIAIIQRDSETRPYFIDKVDGDTIEFALSNASYVTLGLGSSRPVSEQSDSYNEQNIRKPGSSGSSRNMEETAAIVEQRVVTPMVRDCISETILYLAAKEVPSGDYEEVGRDRPQSRDVDLSSGMESVNLRCNEYDTDVMHSRDFADECNGVEAEFAAPVELADLHQSSGDLFSSPEIETHGTQPLQLLTYPCQATTFCLQQDATVNHQDFLATRQQALLVDEDSTHFTNDIVTEQCASPVLAGQNIDADAQNAFVRLPSCDQHAQERDDRREHVFALTGKFLRDGQLRAGRDDVTVDQRYGVHPRASPTTYSFLDGPGVAEDSVCSEYYYDGRLYHEPEFEESSDRFFPSASAKRSESMAHQNRSYQPSLPAITSQKWLESGNGPPDVADQDTWYNFEIYYQTCPVLHQTCTFEKIPKIYQQDLGSACETIPVLSSQPRMVKYSVEFTVEKAAYKCISVLQVYPKLSR